MESNWVFATNSDFLIAKSSQPNVVDLRFSNIWYLYLHTSRITKSLFSVDLVISGYLENIIYVNWFQSEFMKMGRKSWILWKLFWTLLLVFLKFASIHYVQIGGRTDLRILKLSCNDLNDVPDMNITSCKEKWSSFL